MKEQQLHMTFVASQQIDPLAFSIQSDMWCSGAFAKKTAKLKIFFPKIWFTSSYIEYFKKKREDLPVILISHYKGSVLKFVTHGLGKDTVLPRKEGLIHFVTNG